MSDFLEILPNYTSDSLIALLGGMGDPSRDKLAGATYTIPLLSIEQLEASYASSWLIQKAVDLPASDCFREWREWNADQAQREKLEQLERQLALPSKFTYAKTLSRLYGGSALLIGTGANAQRELIVDSGEQLKYVTVLSSKRLQPDELEVDPESRYYGRPKMYKLTASEGRELLIHPSRLMIFVGRPHPDPWGVNDYTRGWGRSILQVIYEAARRADAVSANIAQMTFEANVDVFAIPNFMVDIGKKEYRDRIIERFRLANVGKGLYSTLLHDAKETFDRKQLSFATLPEVLREFVLLVAGAVNMPLTRFLSTSPTGMAATGEHDMLNYYDSIRTHLRIDVEPELFMMDELLIRTALGERPPEISYEWSPLQQLSEKEIAELTSKYADSVSKLVATGLWRDIELRKAVTNRFVEINSFPALDVITAEHDALEGEMEFNLGEGEEVDADAEGN